MYFKLHCYIKYMDMEMTIVAFETYEPEPQPYTEA